MKPSFGLYIHIPYCIKKCPYCDFNSYALEKIGGAMPEERYLKALVGELQHYAELPEWTGRAIHSIFFGGGTPSLFAPSSYEQFFAAAEKSFSIFPDAEITVECNPGTIQESLGADKLKGFRAAGVNRISMGAQSFRAEKLKALGRIHSGGETALAVENIRVAGFENFNLDLIFGVGEETLPQWQEDLAQALALEPAHLSAYGLTIEPGTEFSRLYQQGKLHLPEDDIQAEMYETTQRTLAEHGFEQYEISNYAKPGRACRHNLTYWRGEDYLGLGAGAHSFCSGSSTESFGSRWSNIPGPEHYIDRIDSGGAARQREESVDREKAELEYFFLGLRTAAGIGSETYRGKFGAQLFERYGAVITELRGKDLIEDTQSGVRLTPRGFLFADEVLKAFAEQAGAST